LEKSNSTIPAACFNESSPIAEARESDACNCDRFDETSDA
jgi:hypothetical protein